MALRQVRTDEDPILKKHSKEVKELTPKIKELIEDMFETMYEEKGVGLAAPQIGILKRIFVIDITGNDPKVYINPTIIEEEGIQIGYEGCLSLPGEIGIVKRPKYLKIRALDGDFNEFEETLSDFSAKAFCHENDHLNGILYSEIAYIMNDEISKLEDEDKLEEFLQKKYEEECYK